MLLLVLLVEAQRGIKKRERKLDSEEEEEGEENRPTWRRKRAFILVEVTMEVPGMQVSAKVDALLDLTLCLVFFKPPYH